MQGCHVMLGGGGQCDFTQLLYVWFLATLIKKQNNNTRNQFSLDAFFSHLDNTPFLDYSHSEDH